MDLALNNQQRLICHKTQPTNQPGKRVIKILRVIRNHEPYWVAWRLEAYLIESALINK